MKKIYFRYFLNRFGFVVMTNVMPEEENDKCIQGKLSYRCFLSNDFHLKK